MDISRFHFAEPRCFWGLLMIPLVCLLYKFFYKRSIFSPKLEEFADKHLLPYLVKEKNTIELSRWRSVLFGLSIWSLLIVAMAGPRWDLVEITSFKPNQSLVIILDLSKSMDASDIKPTRLNRAIQEIEDLLNLSKDLKIGLVGFAADAHVIATITDDLNMIRSILPMISTSLVYIQGTKLSPALKTAMGLLKSEAAATKSILVISDGGFQDSDNLKVAKEINEEGINIYTLGVGTKEGAHCTNEKGEFIKRDGKLVISALEIKKLQEISTIGKGQYFNTDYSDNNTKALLEQIYSKAYGNDKKDYTTNYWEEKFYIFIMPIMLIVLSWFRKGTTLPIALIIFVLSSCNSANSQELERFFLNDQQFAKKSLEKLQDLELAIKAFDDPYRRGVAQYKAGKFLEAEESFKQSTRPEVKIDNLYNLGNALARQLKVEEAIETYEKVLELQPNHEKAKHNLEILKKLRPPEEKEKNSGGGGGSRGDKKSKEDKNSNKSPSPVGINQNPNTQNPQEGKGDIDTEQLLSSIPNDPQSFLKNQFYIESQKNKTQNKDDPW